MNYPKNIFLICFFFIALGFCTSQHAMHEESEDDVKTDLLITFSASLMRDIIKGTVADVQFTEQEAKQNNVSLGDVICVEHIAMAAHFSSARDILNLLI